VASFHFTQILEMIGAGRSGASAPPDLALIHLKKNNGIEIGFSEVNAD
jgi:hypothetical protein